jgi:outer membrane cobalamin receptor
MTIIIAALMLGAVASPPPEGADQIVVREPPSLASPALDEDEKPKAALAPQSQAHDADEDDEAGRVQPSGTIVITARRLDTARTQINAGLGATVYSLTNETIENRPGGETGSISEVLSQAPGVTLSGNGLNVRGSRANQVRINNVIVPEAISDPADHLSPRLAETTRLVTGTLPAQFGYAPAGVISVTTKSGLYQHGGQAELFAGSDGMVEPAIEWSGSLQGTSLFASGSLERDHTTLADADGVTARDRRNEIEVLGFADHVIDENNRVSVIFGGSRERHKIGQTSIASGTERSSDGYAVGTFQHTNNDFTVQASLFDGAASDQLRFSDPTHERRSTFGTQIDATDTIGTSHTLRFGLLASHSTARELDLAGNRSSANRTSAALYAQDEWKITPSLTLNPGARVEWLRGFGSAATFEPRASLVWQSQNGLTGHVGYARYSSAPPLGEQPSGSRLPDERDDYFDAGIQQRVGALTLGVDGYWRPARNYLAEREALGSAVPITFGFRRARIRGLELSATYARRGATAWANASLASAKATTIIGGESLFEPAVIAAAAKRWLPMASDRPVTVSGGLTQRLGKLSLGGDILVSSGAVRTLDLADPNGSRHSPYALLGLAAVYHAKIAGQPADLRLDVNNLTNVHYLTSDAANLEGGWTRLGRARAITIGIEQGF